MTPKEKKLLIFGGVGFAVFAVLFISLVAYFARSSGMVARPDGGGNVAGAGLVKRSYFHSFVVGRFPEDVIKEFGPPTRTTQSRILTMYYANFTVDEITGRRDIEAVVEFSPGPGPAVRATFR